MADLWRSGELRLSERVVGDAATWLGDLAQQLGEGVRGLRPRSVLESLQDHERLFEIDEPSVRQIFSSFEPSYGQLKDSDPPKRPTYRPDLSVLDNLRLGLAQIIREILIRDIEAGKRLTRRLKRKVNRNKKLLAEYETALGSGDADPV